MKFSLVTAAALVAPVLSFPTAHLAKRDGALTVELTSTGGAEVAAKLTNTASDTLSLLNYGTFMDTSKVQKVNVYKDCTFLSPPMSSHSQPPSFSPRPWELDID